MSDKTDIAATVLEAEPAAALALPAQRLVQDWKTAYERGVVYLRRLGLEAHKCAPLAAEAVERAAQHDGWTDGSDAVTETFRALQALLPQRYPITPKPWHAALDPFTAWRLDVGLSGRFAGGEMPLPPSVPRYPTRGRVFSSMPQLTRRGMVPEPIERRLLRRLLNRLLRGKRGDAARRRALRQQRRRLPWTRVARRRRLLLSVLVLIPSIIASGFMVNVLPHQAGTPLEVAIVVFFGALFGWISIGFWTALLGFLMLIGRWCRFKVTNVDPSDAAEFEPEGRTAIVMPICEEPVQRVFAGLRAIYDSLARTGALAHFDFFVLSDSVQSSTVIKEEQAWAAWCRAVNGFGQIFYRRRRVRLERKSGNVADFCRRWGKQYRYMIMLDADSIMAGETLVRLVRMMERHPEAGMIQTAPTAVNRRSLFARVQQFSSRVFGPMLAAGLHFWQLGDGQYWGHNAIIRVAPFMDHCALPRLPGKPPLGGEILSHDFVEAALMGRAGWTLWLAFDLPGSYEEVPSTLLEEMKRDRRWCQGNLQHLRLLFTEGLFGAHRALFVNGVLSYVSALLWFAFLTLSTAEAIENALREPEYFPHGRSLFPEWPVWHPDWAVYLAAVTAMILFLPKLLSIVLIVFKQRNARAYGGVSRLSLSVVLEILFSSLLAPIRMVFHSRFVVQNLLGRTVAWRSQGREDAATGWWEAIRRHGFDTVFASAWGISLYVLNPHYFWWLTPIIVALILAVPSSVLSSRTGWGDRARAWGLFLIPEESAPPAELLDLQRYLREAREAEERLAPMERDGFVRAAVDPYVNALHCALLRGRRSLNASLCSRRRALLERAFAEGPFAITAQERKLLLIDPDMTAAVHQHVWTLTDLERARRWDRPNGNGEP